MAANIEVAAWVVPPDHDLPDWLRDRLLVLGARQQLTDRKRSIRAQARFQVLHEHKEQVEALVKAITSEFEAGTEYAALRNLMDSGQ